MAPSLAHLRVPSTLLLGLIALHAQRQRAHLFALHPTNQFTHKHIFRPIRSPPSSDFPDLLLFTCGHQIFLGIARVQ